MSGFIRYLKVFALPFCALIFLFQEYSAAVTFNAGTFLYNMQNYNNQTALCGTIDSMRIIRGETVFELGPGDVTIFDFGAGKPAAAIYKGKGRFLYTPPDDVEKFQLQKFTGMEKINSGFDLACLFFTIDLFDISDTTRLREVIVDPAYWRKLYGVIDDTFDHFKLNIANLLLWDLLRDEKAGIFFADFDAGGVGHLAFYENPAQDDKGSDYMWERWRQRIIGGTGSESIGHSAGPPVMGRRLNSTESFDYYENVYLKGAFIFHMIRYMLHDYKANSDDKFAAFLKDMVQTYKGKVITTQGLQELLEKHIGSDMSWFFNQWVYGVDIPDYDFDYETEPTPEGKYKVDCVIKQKKVPDDFKMIVPITVIFDEGKYIHMKFWVDKPVNEIELPLLPYKPDKIIFNTYDAVLCR